MNSINKSNKNGRSWLNLFGFFLCSLLLVLAIITISRMTASWVSNSLNASSLASSPANAVGSNYLVAAPVILVACVLIVIRILRKKHLYKNFNKELIVILVLAAIVVVAGANKPLILMPPSGGNNALLSGYERAHIIPSSCQERAGRRLRRYMTCDLEVGVGTPEERTVTRYKFEDFVSFDNIQNLTGEFVVYTARGDRKIQTFNPFDSILLLITYISLSLIVGIYVLKFFLFKTRARSSKSGESEPKDK